MRNVLVVLLVALMLFGLAAPVEAGRGGIKGRADDAPMATKGRSVSVSDDDGKGRDKGLPGPDKPPQGGDGNNGTGNDIDCEDDNNGIGVPSRCKPSPVPAPMPPSPAPAPNRPQPTPLPPSPAAVPGIPSPSPAGCKLVCIGHVCELFPEDRFPSAGNERWILAEARDRLEYPMAPGQSLWIFFWTSVFGHGPEAHSELVTCEGQGDIVIVEPVWLQVAVSDRGLAPR